MKLRTGHGVKDSDQSTLQTETLLFPGYVSNYGKNLVLTFSEAVARRVPEGLRERQARLLLWAWMTSGGATSVLARLTTSTFPNFRDGKTRRELSLFGHRAHKPAKKRTFLWHNESLTDSKWTRRVSLFSQVAQISIVCSGEHAPLRETIWVIHLPMSMQRRLPDNNW